MHDTAIKGDVSRDDRGIVDSVVYVVLSIVWRLPQAYALWLTVEINIWSFVKECASEEWEGAIYGCGGVCTGLE